MLQLRTLPIIFGVVIFSAFAYADNSRTLHPVKDKPAAPDFSLQDTDGKRHQLKDYRGRVMIINFWATWCPPCRFELPSMERAYQRLKKENIEILAIDVGEDADTIFTFTADYPVTFPLLMDLNSTVINRYSVIGLPTTFIVDPQGRIVYRAVGTRTWDDDAVVGKIKALKQ